MEDDMKKDETAVPGEGAAMPMEGGDHAEAPAEDKAEGGDAMPADGAEKPEDADKKW